MKFGINFFPSFRPEDTTTANYYDQCLRLAARADELGYASIKTVEHSFYDYGGHSPNPCVFLSAVAARTKRIRLITGAVIPAFHHPAHLGGDLDGGVVRLCREERLQPDDRALCGEARAAAGIREDVPAALPRNASVGE